MSLTQDRSPTRNRTANPTHRRKSASGHSGNAAKTATAWMMALTEIPQGCSSNFLTPGLV